MRDLKAPIRLKFFHTAADTLEEGRVGQIQNHESLEKGMLVLFLEWHVEVPQSFSVIAGVACEVYNLPQSRPLSDKVKGM